MFDIHHISRSLKLNYKSWLIMFISCIIICYNYISFINGWAQYLLCTFYCYLAHRLSHEPLGFFINRAHIYHHEHTDWMSHAIQVCVEITASFSPLVLLYYILDLPTSVFLVDPYIFFLFWIFYTTVHNINYGYFRVNQVHAKHHDDYSVNYGPDICDIVFGTKYPVDGVENTDHYIPNIIAATFITYIFRHFYERSPHKRMVKNVLFRVYVSVCFVVGFFTTKKTFMDIKKMTDDEVVLFNRKIQEIWDRLYAPIAI